MPDDLFEMQEGLFGIHVDAFKMEDSL